MKMLRMLRNL